MSGALLIVGPDDELPATLDDLTHVVLTLEPLARVLPAAWLAQIRNRLTHPYEVWLEALLDDPPRDWPTVSAFWARRHYDALVEQWVSVLGADRLRIKINEAGPPQQALTASEAELIRRVNVVFHRRDWPAERYRQVMRRGVTEALANRSLEPGTAIATPAWAVERANAVAAADAQRLATAGVEIEGDLAALSAVTPEPAALTPEGNELSLDVAADAVIAAIDAVAATWPD